MDRVEDPAVTSSTTKPRTVAIVDPDHDVSEAANTVHVTDTAVESVTPSQDSKQTIPQDVVAPTSEPSTSNSDQGDEGLQKESAAPFSSHSGHEPDTPHLEVPNPEDTPESSLSSSHSPQSSQLSESSETQIALSSTAPSSTRTSLTEAHSQSCSTQPASILRSPTGSAHNSPNVSFAPLPQTDQRKRSSNVPLGVAARSRMLRQRRMIRSDTIPPLPEGGAHVHANVASLTLEQMRELEAIQAQQAQERAQPGAGGVVVGVGSRQPTSPYAPMWQDTPDDDVMPEEDALLALGRMVKGGARTLWRRVSHSQLKGRTKSPMRKGEAIQHVPGERREKMHGLRRSLSEPRQSTNVNDSLTVSVLVKESGHLFDEPEEMKTKSSPKVAVSGRPGEVSVDAVKVTERMHGGIVQEEEEEEEGRVWEEVVDGEITRRMEELAAQAKAKERKSSGLTGKLASLNMLGAKKTMKPR